MAYQGCWGMPYCNIAELVLGGGVERVQGGLDDR